ncbi:hypothetical protein ACWDA9_39680, partial [Streptomyces sp. NPDC001193]
MARPRLNPDPHPHPHPHPDPAPHPHPHPDPHPDPAPHPRRWAVLAVVLVAEVMDLLDATVTGVAAPAIAAGLGGGRATAQWLGAAYT